MTRPIAAARRPMDTGPGRRAPSTATAAGALALAAGLAAPAAAQDRELAFVGSWSGLDLHRNFERPFWGGEVTRLTDGALAAEVTTFDQMGIEGGAVFRLLSQGLFDVGATVADYAVEDAPELEGLDLPLTATTVAGARAVAEAYAPLLDEALAERFDARLLAIAPYPAQVVFCNAPIEGLGDLAGLTIRASGRSTAEFVDALGATGVTLAFNEVPGALQRGVVDCAVTGSLSGYNSGWHDVSTHLLPLPIGGWDPVVTAIHADTWDSLGADLQQAFMEAVGAGFTDPAWAAAVGETEQGIACLTGIGTCERGEPGSLILVEPTPEDGELARRLLEEDVLPAWTERVGTDWAARWNETVGVIAGVAAPVE